MPGTNFAYSAVAEGFAIDGWRDEMQPFLQKSLVASPIADTTISNDLVQGQVVHYPYLEASGLTAQDYSPHTDIGISASTATDETLSADQKKVVGTYMDDVNSLQANYARRQELQKRMAYTLRDTIDQHFFTQSSALTASTATRLDAGLMTAGTHDTSGITAGSATSAGTAGIIDIFSKARRYMRNNNVPEGGDWYAVIDNAGAELIERITIEKGFNLADTTLKNGYMGDFLGFNVYRSSNLYVDSSTAGGFDSTDYWLFGKLGGIDLAVQQSPNVVLKDEPKMLGQNIMIWSVYGAKLFTKKKPFSLVAPISTVTW